MDENESQTTHMTGSAAAAGSACWLASDDDISSAPLSFVVCAAIRHPNETIICGARHYDPIMRAIILNMCEFSTDKARRLGWYSCAQGFVDNKGQWLTRGQAWNVAKLAGQIRYPNVSTPGTLYSENLY